MRCLEVRIRTWRLSDRGEKESGTSEDDSQVSDLNKCSTSRWLHLLSWETMENIHLEAEQLWGREGAPVQFGTH